MPADTYQRLIVNLMHVMDVALISQGHCACVLPACNGTNLQCIM